MKLEFDDEILNSDELWWTRTLKRQDEIKAFVDKSGRTFYLLRTFDGENFRIHIHPEVAKDGLLFFSTGSLSDYIGIRKIKCLTADESARTEYEAEGGTAEKDSYLKKWHAGAKDHWRPHV